MADREYWEGIAKLIHGYDPFSDSDGFTFDPDLAEKACNFFPARLKHVEGKMYGKPFKLEDWQKAQIANLFGWVDDEGYRRYREAFVYVPRKNGKAVALDTLLPTPTGWTTMGEVRVGDRLYDEQGNECSVAEVHDINLRPESYRILFSNGQEVRACTDHLWVTTAKVDKVGAGVGGRQSELFAGVPRGTVAAPKTRTRNTREIYETQSYGKRGDRNHSLAMPQPVPGRHSELPIDPYVLGVWLGDGDSDAGRITCADEDVAVVEEASSCGGYAVSQNNSKTRTSRYTLLGLQPTLRQCGLLKNKHIPSEYLRASVSQRLALLQGLMDTDGHIDPRGTILQFCTTRKVLREGFCELLSTLGVKYGTREKRLRCSGREVPGAAHYIQFMMFREMPAFRLQRKLDRMKRLSDSKVAPRSRSVQIVSVEKIDPTPMRCITVDSPTGQYLFGETMLPTHNTPMIAGLANYVFFCDAEHGQQNMIAAASRDQAAQLFRHASGMIQQNPTLSKRCRIYGGTAGQEKRILRESDGSFTRVIASEATKLHGGNLHLGVVDELHAQPNRDLVEVLETSMASENRPQPMMIYITTADYHRESVCNSKYLYAKRVRDGDIDDQRFLPVIYEAQATDDWTDPEVWAKANPNLGVSVSLDYLKRACEKAQHQPAYENTFKRLHLDIQTENDERIIQMVHWDACDGEVDPASLFGRPCHAGLDLSTEKDISALVLVFPEDGYQVVPFFWIPIAHAERRQRYDGVPYQTWVERGLIEDTDGDFVSHRSIGDRIIEVSEQYDLRSIAFDRAQGQAIYERMDDYGVTMLKHPQTTGWMNGPFRELLTRLGNRDLRHGGNDVLRWMATNVVAVRDDNDRIRPSRGKSSEKIDGIVALIMALSACNENEGYEAFQPGSLAL